MKRLRMHVGKITAQNWGGLTNLTDSTLLRYAGSFASVDGTEAANSSVGYNPWQQTAAHKFLDEQ